MEKHEFEKLPLIERINFSKREGIFLGEFRYLSFDVSLFRSPKFYIEIWKLPNEKEVSHIESINTTERLDIYLKAISQLNSIPCK